MTTKACDISYWQGKISASNFKKVKEAGITNIILRTSYTTLKSFTLNKDSVFENNIKNAASLGFNIGVYHYSQALSESEAIKEAKYMLNIIEPHKDKINLGVWFDYEFGGRLNASKASKLGKTKTTNICNAFCETIENAGYTAGVYACLAMLNGYLYPSSFDNKYLTWVAQYASKCSYTRKKYMWQYTSSGKVNGLSGRIDMNYLYGNVTSVNTSTVAFNENDIDVDGEWGEETTRKLQKILGIEQTGKVTSQPKSCKKYLAACTTSSWKFVTSAKGCETIKKLQSTLGVSVTGKMNTETIKALQKKVGTGVDGYFGTRSVRAFQSYLNHNDK